MTVCSGGCEVKFAVLVFLSSRLFCMVSFCCEFSYNLEVPFCGVVSDLIVATIILFHSYFNCFSRRCYSGWYIAVLVGL